MLCRLQPLSCLAALTHCKLQHCPGIRSPKDLSALADLTCLTCLDLCGCSNLHGSTISSLATITSLRWASMHSAACSSFCLTLRVLLQC